MSLEHLRNLLKAHVKGHTRVVNGKVVYIHDYDTANPVGREAELHERTVIGKHRSGTHYLRATDAEDGRQIQEAADRLGIKTEKRRAGANHFGRIGAYDHFHFESPEHAMAVHTELKNHGNASAGGNPPISDDEHATQASGAGKPPAEPSKVATGGADENPKAKSNKAWGASKAAFMTNRGDGKYVTAQKKAQGLHEAAADAHALAHDGGGGSDKGREHYYEASRHYNTAHNHATQAMAPAEVAEHASKVAGKLGFHADAASLQENHGSYGQHSEKHMLAIEAHARARDAHRSAADAARIMGDEKASRHHMKQADEHHSKVEHHNEEMGIGHGEISRRAKAAEAASKNAKTPEGHAAAAEAHHNAAKIQYDPEVRADLETRARFHEGEAAKPAEETKGHAMPPKPTTPPPSAGQRPTETQNIGNAAATTAKRADTMRAASKGAKHEHLSVRANNASLTAQTRSLQAKDSDSHARAYYSHVDAKNAHEEAAGMAQHPSHANAHQAIADEHTAHADAHAKLSGAKEKVQAAEDASSHAWKYDNSTKPEDFDKAIAAHDAAGSAQVSAMDMPGADRAHHSQQADEHAHEVRKFEGWKKEHESKAAEGEKAKAKEHLGRYTDEANKAGAAAAALTRKGNDDPDGIGAGHHDEAAKAHALASKKHMEARNMAEMAGEAKPMLYHHEMSDHHSEAHIQHKHEIDHPGQVARAGTKEIIRAQDAFDKHYGEAETKAAEAAPDNKVGIAPALAKDHPSRKAAEAEKSAGYSVGYTYMHGGKKEKTNTRKATKDAMLTSQIAESGSNPEHHDMAANAHQIAAEAHEGAQKTRNGGMYTSIHSKAQDHHLDAAHHHRNKAQELRKKG